jgi:hypothetical protein
VVSTPDVPAPVTRLGCCLAARDSVDSFSAIDLDWTPYNEVGQKDVTRYRIYLGPAFFTNVLGLKPYGYVPAETKQATVTGLDPYGIYYVDVVAEDVGGQFDPVVRSQSAQASVDRVREVRDLTSACGTNWLTFTWQPPEGADPRTNALLAAYRLYFAGAAMPLVLDRFALSYTATNLLAGHGYPVRIETVDNLGRKSDGASLLAATLAPNPAQTVANAFHGITRVAWERMPSEVVVDRFVVHFAEGNATSLEQMTPVHMTRGHSVDFTNLVMGRTYSFAVTARNIGGCESTELPVRVVAVTPSETGPTVLEAGRYANRTFTIAVNGPLGADYVLLGSTNLIDWLRLQTNTPAVLPFLLTVTNQPGMNWFYRMKIE